MVMEYAIEEIDVNGKDAGLLEGLLACWRASVEATHSFLSPNDVERIAVYVPDAMRAVRSLAVCRGAGGKVVGFIGIEGPMVEMLFIDPAFRGRGAGTCLLNFAVSTHGVTLVDVNEQNGQAVDFYRDYGFKVMSCSETDGMGDPFPILHMRLR